jgi:hypothetical protein
LHPVRGVEILHAEDCPYHIDQYPWDCECGGIGAVVHLRVEIRKEDGKALITSPSLPTLLLHEGVDLIPVIKELLKYA